MSRDDDEIVSTFNSSREWKLWIVGGGNGIDAINTVQENKLLLSRDIYYTMKIKLSPRIFYIKYIFPLTHFHIKHSYTMMFEPCIYVRSPNR